MLTVVICWHLKAIIFELSKEKAWHPDVTALHNHQALCLFTRQDYAPELSVALLALFAGEIWIQCQPLISYCSVCLMSLSETRNKNLNICSTALKPRPLVGRKFSPKGTVSKLSPEQRHKVITLCFDP